MLNPKAIYIHNEYPIERQNHVQTSVEGKNFSLPYKSSPDIYKCFIVFNSFTVDGQMMLNIKDLTNDIIHGYMTEGLTKILPYQIYNISNVNMTPGNLKIEFNIKIHLKKLPIIDSKHDSIKMHRFEREERISKIPFSIDQYRIVTTEGTCHLTTDIELDVQAYFQNGSDLTEFNRRVISHTESLASRTRKAINLDGSVIDKLIIREQESFVLDMN